MRGPIVLIAAAVRTDAAERKTASLDAPPFAWSGSAKALLRAGPGPLLDAVGRRHGDHPGAACRSTRAGPVA